jgi:hypothetical protein
MLAQVGYSVAGRSRGRVAPCAVCTMHMETRIVGFLVSSDLASKPAVTVSSGLASKSAVTVSGSLASKPDVTVFFSLATKLVATFSSPGFSSKPRWWRVYRFGHQNL